MGLCHGFSRANLYDRYLMNKIQGPGCQFLTHCLMHPNFSHLIMYPQCKVHSVMRPIQDFKLTTCLMICSRSRAVVGGGCLIFRKNVLQLLRLGLASPGQVASVKGPGSDARQKTTISSSCSTCFSSWVWVSRYVNFTWLKATWIDPGGLKAIEVGNLNKIEGRLAKYCRGMAVIARHEWSCLRDGRRRCWQQCEWTRPRPTLP